MVDIKTIPEGWVETTVGEIVKTNISSIGKDFEFDEILYLDTGSITENKIESLQKYTLSDAPSRAKRLVKNQDIVYSTVRPNQKHFGFIQNPQENLVVSTGFTVITGIENKTYGKFLYYFLTQDFITNTLQQTAEHCTSTYPSIRPEHIEDLEIILPPFSEQQAIAGILSSFDDKIELLREQNETLEKTAQTIFQEWFGKYGIDDELPEGWKLYQLKELFSFVKGKKPREISEKMEKNFVPQILIDTFNGGQLIFASSENTVLSEVEDLIMVMDGASSGRVEFGYAGAVGSTLSLLRFNLDIRSILYFFLKAKEGNIREKTTGSAIPHTDKEKVYRYEIALPISGTNLEKINLVFSDFRKKIVLNRTQIQSLSKTRDELLPRLMSGEVRVRM